MILRKHPEGFPTTGWVDKLDRELPIKLTKVKREDCEELVPTALCTAGVIGTAI